MMLKRLIVGLLMMFLVAGCTPKPVNQGVAAPLAEAAAVVAGGPLLAADAPAEAGTIARVGNTSVSRDELNKAMMEAYGLKVLLFQVQLKVALEEARQRSIEVTKDDIDAELMRTMKAGFADAAKEDYPGLLDQLLERKGVSRLEFDMVIQTNAILRKIAEPQLRNTITPENVKEAFHAMYGETAIIRHIQCSNTQEAIRAKMRVVAGEKFEDVAKAMSRNPNTAPLGGELPPISREQTSWGTGMGKIPEAFKAWIFSGVKVGDISDGPVYGEGAYHILKLEKKIDPKAVKFEDVKEKLRVDLGNQLLERAIVELRARVSNIARKTLVIDDPMLRKQFELKMAAQEKAIKEQEKVRAELMNRASAASQPAPFPVLNPSTVPSTQVTPGTSGGATAPSTSPAKLPTGERPPATRSTAVPVDNSKK